MTIFVDGDTSFCADPKPIFDLLDLADVDWMAAPEVRSHPRPYYNVNGGVILYGSSLAAKHLIFSWIIVQLQSGSRGDMLSLMHLLDPEGKQKMRMPIRWSLLPRNAHLTRCSKDLMGHCTIQGDVILLHGRCWNYLSSERCRLVNQDASPRRLVGQIVQPAQFSDMVWYNQAYFFKNDTVERVQSVPVTVYTDVSF